MSDRLSFDLNPDARAVMACVDSFEQSDVTHQDDLRSFIREVPESLRSSALVELVKVDFERRTKRGARRTVNEYLREYPELRDSQDHVLELCQEEFELRERMGEHPQPAEYTSICPKFAPRTTVQINRAAVDTLPYGKTAAPSSPSAPPNRIGKYTFRKRLGEGGFGVVCEYYDELLERSVAIKIRRRTTSQPGLTDDMLHEARSITRLNHPNIVKLLEAAETDEGVGYVVYEHIDGATLEQRLARGDYTHEQAAEWIARVAEALHVAHQSKVIHRDIKPANIMIDSAGQPRIVDFGLARRDEKFFTNDAGRVMGTTAYLSPEQARGDSHWASAQSDLYSLGVVLYELLCRQRPFHADDFEELLDQVKFRTPAPPSSIDDTIPTGLEDVCLRALSKDPGPRFRNGSEMAAAVRRALEPQKQSNWPSLLRWGASAAATVALCLVALWLFNGNNNNTPAPAAVPVAFSSFNVFKDNAAVDDAELPLAAGDELEVQVALERAAYSYLIVYEQGGPARLLWPAKAELDQQSVTDRINFPPLDQMTAKGLTLPATDGSSMIVALACNKRLTDEQLNELMMTPLTLSVTPEEASTEKRRYLVADPPPKINDHIVMRSETKKPSRLLVSEEFKSKLAEMTDAYYGVLVPHVKEPPK